MSVAGDFGLTKDNREKIIRLRNQRATYRAIHEQTGVSETTCRRYYLAWLRHVAYRLPDRPRVLCPRGIRRLKRTTMKKRKLGSRMLAKECLLQISHQTILRTLNRQGIVKKKIRQRPVHQQHHKDPRLKFAKYHILHGTDWKTVICSDEKRFCLDGPDGWNYYWCGKNDG
jgi:DNA invertase Pin-like site-specific DNA recombinase